MFIIFVVLIFFKNNYLCHDSKFYTLNVYSFLDISYT